MSADLTEAKRELRRRILALRDALREDERARASAIIIQRVLACAEFARARNVLAYASFGSELDTSALLARALETGRTLILPRVDRTRHELVLHRVTDLSAGLRAGTLGIREPNPERCAEVDPRDVDFALVPGVAFAATGARLGYGAGYFDRLLPRLPAATIRIAGAYAVQIVEVVPVGPRDVPVDRIVTQSAQFDRPPGPNSSHGPNGR